MVADEPSICKLSFFMFSLFHRAIPFRTVAVQAKERGMPKAKMEKGREKTPRALPKAKERGKERVRRARERMRKVRKGRVGRKARAKKGKARRERRVRRAKEDGVEAIGREHLHGIHVVLCVFSEE